MLPRPATATTTDGWHWNGGSVVACLCMFIHRTTPISESSLLLGGGTIVHLKVNILANGMQPPSKGESVAII